MDESIIGGGGGGRESKLNVEQNIGSNEEFLLLRCSIVLLYCRDSGGGGKGMSERSSEDAENWKLLAICDGGITLLITFSLGFQTSLVSFIEFPLATLGFVIYPNSIPVVGRISPLFVL